MCLHLKAKDLLNVKPWMRSLNRETPQNRQISESRILQFLMLRTKSSLSHSKKWSLTRSTNISNWWSQIRRSISKGSLQICQMLQQVVLTPSIQTSWYCQLRPVIQIQTMPQMCQGQIDIITDLIHVQVEWAQSTNWQTKLKQNVANLLKSTKSLIKLTIT